MKIFNAALVGGLLCAFAACANTSNNGGHVVGNPIISESAAKKGSDPTCDCASSKDAKVKAACKCASDSKTSTATCKDGDKNCAK